MALKPLKKCKTILPLLGTVSLFSTAIAHAEMIKADPNGMLNVKAGQDVTNPDLAKHLSSNFGVSGAQARNFVNGISGEIHASVHADQYLDSDMVMNPAMARLDSSMGNATVAAPDAHKIFNGKVTAWSQFSGHLGHAYSGYAAKMKTRYGGFTAGMDTKAGGWIVGGMLSYGRSMINIYNHRSSSGYSNNVAIGGYAGRQWGDFSLKLGASYAFNMINQNRHVQGQHLTSSYLGGVANAKAAVAYNLHPFSGVRPAFFKNAVITPFLSAEYVNENTNSSSEKGGDLALRIKHSDDGMAFGSAGLSVGTSFKGLGVTWMPSISANYQHNFTRNTTQNIMSFKNAASAQKYLGTTHNKWRVGGNTVSDTVAYTTAGIAAKVDNHWAANASYFGGYGDQNVWMGCTMGMSYSF